jgi:hypothetical protein
MSQGEYLKRKNIIYQLEDQSVLPAVLSSKFYTQCIQYTIQNEIINENIRFGQVTTIVKEDLCPKFILCQNTNERPNRKLIIRPMTTFLPMFIKDRNPPICDPCITT